MKMLMGTILGMLLLVAAPAMAGFETGGGGGGEIIIIICKENVPGNTATTVNRNCIKRRKDNKSTSSSNFEIKDGVFIIDLNSVDVKDIEIDSEKNDEWNDIEEDLNDNVNNYIKDIVVAGSVSIWRIKFSKLKVDLKGRLQLKHLGKDMMVQVYKLVDGGLKEASSKVIKNVKWKWVEQQTNGYKGSLMFMVVRKKDKKQSKDIEKIISEMIENITNNIRFALNAFEQKEEKKEENKE